MADEKIVISFAVEGVQALKGVFDSLEQRMVRFDRAATSSTERSSRERVASARREVDQREKEYAKLSREAAKWEKQSVKEADRAAKDRTRSAEVEEKRKLAIKETSMRMAHRLLEQEVAAEKRAGEEKVRVAEQVAKREASVAKQYRSRITGAMGTGLGNFASFGTRMVGAGMALGGGFSVANAMRSSMAFDKAVAQASNASYIPGKTTRAEIGADRVASIARGVQATSNIDKTEAANALKTYVGIASDFEGMATVDKKTGRTGLQELGIMSKASGTDFNDLIRAAGSLKANNPGMGPEALMGAMRSLIGSGRQGTLPLDQLASSVGKIQATAGSFAGGATPEGFAKSQSALLGLAQITGRATGGDAAEAATSVAHFSVDLMHAAKKGHLSNKDVYEGGDPSKGLRAPGDLMQTVFEKTRGRSDLALDILTAKGGKKIFDSLKPEYDAAELRQKGSGAKVVGDLVRNASTEYSSADVQRDFAEVMKTNGERIDASLKTMGEVLESKATPFLERFAKSLSENQGSIEKFLDAMSDAAEFLVSHPWQAMFMVLEAEMLKSVAAAAIGEAVKKALVGGTTAGFAGGAATAAPIIAAAMALAIQTGIAMIDQVDKDAARNQGAAATGGARSEALSLRIKRGVATPAEIEEAKALQGRLKNLAETGTTEGGDAAKAAHRYSRIAASVAGSLGFSDPKTQMDREQAATNAALAKLTAALEEATKRGFGGAGAPASGGDSSRPGAKPQSHAPMSDSSRGGLQH